MLQLRKTERGIKMNGGGANKIVEFARVVFLFISLFLDWLVIVLELSLGVL